MSISSLSALVLLSGCAGASTAARTSGGPSGPAQSLGTEADVTISPAIANLPLVDSDGKPTSLAALHGKFVVLNDTMTLCQETCPLDTANLVQTARAVDKAGLTNKVVFLTITVDPARDTPAQLVSYRQLYSPVPSNWLTLTGTPANIAKLWKVLGVWSQKVPEGNPPSKNWRTGQTLTYDVEHADELFFLNTAGNERFVISGPADVQKGTSLPKAMRTFLDSDGVTNLEHPDPDSWTVPQALQALTWLTGHHFGS
jgi:protein SCO1/2